MRRLQILKSAAVAMFVAFILVATTPRIGAAQDLPREKAASIVAQGEYLARAGDCVACHTSQEANCSQGGARC